MSKTVCFVCPKCASISSGTSGIIKKCNYCNIELIETDMLFSEMFSSAKAEDIKLKEQSLKEKYAYSNPLYNEELDKQIREQVRKEVDNIKPASQNSNVPKCPTCGSTNIKRISTANRAVSIGLFGLLSGKIGKNYECKNCKAKW